MKHLRLLLVLSSLTVLGVATVASASGSRAVVNSKSTKFGTILVNSSGQTLYLDVNDKSGHFACTGQCAAAWPVLKTSGKPKAAGKVKASMLGTVKHGSATQVTYNGHPLYTFIQDSKSAPISGEGVNGFYVVSTSGSKVTKKTTTTSTTTSSSSTSGGYKY
jgi:predicted lipoprotein with Yx(FWY)xxD motif